MMKRTAFMVMPFSDDLVRNAYEHILKPVFNKYNIVIRKADDIWSVNPIYDDIIREIRRAFVVVVDISGKNPNVFYELGVAHILKKERTIILSHDDFTSTPFDVAQFRIIQYSDSIESTRKLERDLEKTLQIILSDVLHDYTDEFNIVFELSGSIPFSFGSSIGLSILFKNNGVVKKGVGYYYGNQGEAGSGVSATINRELEPFLRIGFVEEDDKNFYITEKGKLYVRYLHEKRGMKDFTYQLSVFDDER